MVYLCTVEDIFRQHTPATAKAPAVHDYVAKLVSNCRQGVDSTTAKSLMEKYSLPDNVDMVVPAVNPEIWADLPSTVRDEEKRLRATQRMGHAALAPMLQACSSLTTAVEKGEGLSPAQTAALLTRWWTPAHWLCRLIMNATWLEGRPLNRTPSKLSSNFAAGTSL